MMLAATVNAKSVYFVVGLIFIYNMNMSFLDVVVDSIMVIEARRDPIMGS